MIDTNALLSIAFTLVSNFNQVVEVPHGAFPTRVEDLRKYHIGSPPTGSPTELYLVDRRGPEFWIKDGVVYEFSTPGSLLQLGNPAALSRFMGTPTLTTNQALELATRTVRRLVKSGDPLAGRKPFISDRYATREPMPFYWISWPDTNIYVRYAAGLEIDARSGEITYLHLKNKGFFDPALAQQISNRVYTPDPLPPKPKRLAPYPSTNMVVEGITSWLWLCQRLGVQPGTETNLASVDWENCWVYTNSPLAPTQAVCQVHFKNGACFESINGVAFSHYAADAAFSGAYSMRHTKEWERFKGPVVRNWQDLAHDLEHTLTARVGIPASLLAPLTPEPMRRPPEMGTEAIKRLVGDWRRWPKEVTFEAYDQTPSAFRAELDLQTGELKYINLEEPAIVAALGRAQGKELHLRKSP